MMKKAYQHSNGKLTLIWETCKWETLKWEIFKWHAKYTRLVWLTLSMGWGGSDDDGFNWFKSNLSSVSFWCE